jgi:hypothetical protein
MHADVMNQREGLKLAEGHGSTVGNDKDNIARPRNIAVGIGWFWNLLQKV